ncbi:MAG TPA: TMEM175 family protein [Rubrobacteraceae bacterium]|nr:TMEM175 family protein [Rubrobacteraceae bacterium]
MKIHPRPEVAIHKGWHRPNAGFREDLLAAIRWIELIRSRYGAGFIIVGLASEKETRISGSEEHWTESGTDIERTVFFSDAVFAIAITLLALDLRVPEISESTAASELPGALLDLWPYVFSFLMSFWVIGFYWLAHHRIFHRVRVYDRRLLLINLLFLMWIVLMPFSSSLIGEYENLQLPVIFYSVHNILAGSTLSWLWRHASKEGRLVKADLDPRAVRYINLRAMFLPAVFVLSIGLSFLSVEIARGSWLLAFLAGPILQRYGRRSPSP